MIVRKILGILLHSCVLAFGIFLILTGMTLYGVNYDMGLVGRAQYYGVLIAMIMFLLVGILIICFAIPGIIMWAIRLKPRMGKIHYLNIGWVVSGFAFVYFFAIMLYPIAQYFFSYPSAFGEYYKMIFTDWHVYVFYIGYLVYAILFAVGHSLKKKKKYLAGAIVFDIGILFFAVMLPLGYRDPITGTNGGMFWACYVFGLIILLLHSAMCWIEIGTRHYILEQGPSIKEAKVAAPKPKVEAKEE